jgi:DNA invertase Pin-like site-specific DNA recombinase
MPRFAAERFPERNLWVQTVIYARYSSKLQDSRSIEGQLADCRARCEREGWTIVGEFHDAAISGNRGITEEARPGFYAMMQLVMAGGIDQVLCDTTSRIGRNERDRIEIRDDLKYVGCRLFSLQKGVIEGLTASIEAAVDAEQRRAIAHNVRRGQRTCIDQGRVPAGIAYGYKLANKLTERGEVIRGLREIDEDQAEVVRRIFREAAAGRSAFAIAKGLNLDGIPGPRGNYWMAPTIFGNPKFGNGILRNRAYIGELVVGRTVSVENPRSRKISYRPLAKEEWRSKEVPELRIVDQEVWDTVQAEIARRSQGPAHAQRRPKHWLSGLGVCSVCGSPYTRAGRDQWSCAKRSKGGACTNGHTVATKRYMAALLDALNNDLMHPDLFDSYEAEYREARKERLSSQRRDRQKLERKRGEITRKIERLADAIANGAGDVSEIVTLLATLRTERADIERQLDQIEAVELIPFLPGVREQYRREMAALEEALASPEASLEAVPRFRALIHRVVLSPNPVGRGAVITVEPRIDEALRLATGEAPRRALHRKAG